MSRDKLIQPRSGTAADWTAADPTLADNELGFVTDDDELLLGDGASAYSALPDSRKYGSKAAANAAYGQVVHHGATASTARPTSGLSLLWVGTVEPTNASDFDRYANETTGTLRIKLPPGVWVTVNAREYATLDHRPVNARNRADADANALGDDSGAALSTRFSSLAEAQAVFPHVTALTQTIDWAALQSVFDIGSRVADIPPGLFNVGADGLVLTKNVSLGGADGLKSRIVAGSGMDATTDVITVAIDDNQGNTGVRNWRCENLMVQATNGGRHAVYIEGDGVFGLLTSQIINNNLTGNAGNGGNAIHVNNNLSHCEIAFNTLQSPVHMKCYDANVIRKNMFFGARIAVVFDLIFGVKNNTVEDNTIVTRDGAVHIIDGDDIRILNNQVELAQGHTPAENQSPTSSMVWIEGASRKSLGTVIEYNNFGGGTNLDHLIYVDNAEKTTIDKNDLVACNVAEVYFTANATYNILGRRNHVRDQSPSNPRTRTRFKEEVTDLGVGNMGVLHPASELAHQNGWAGGDFWKDEYGVVYFQGSLSSGTTTDGTVIGTLPAGFRPVSNRRIACPTSGGLGRLLIRGTGSIEADGALPSNLIYPHSFTSGQTDS